MDCMQCGNEFEAKRSTAKYCSDRCRWLAHNAKDAPTLTNAKDEAGRIITNAKTKPTSKVNQAEIDALPQALKDDINQLCDSNPEMYDDRQERLVRAVAYRRKFPNRVYHSSGLSGYDTGPDLAIQARLGKHTEQGNIRVAKPGDEEYVGCAGAVTARQEAR